MTPLENQLQSLADQYGVRTVLLTLLEQHKKETGKIATEWLIELGVLREDDGYYTIDQFHE